MDQGFDKESAAVFLHKFLRDEPVFIRLVPGSCVMAETVVEGLELSGFARTDEDAKVVLANNIWDVIHHKPNVAYLPLQTRATHLHDTLKARYEEIFGAVNDER